MRFLFAYILLLSAFTLKSQNYLDAIPKYSETLSGYAQSQVENRLQQSGLHNIEGIWQFVNNGTTIAIERFNPDNLPNNGVHLYRLVIIESPNRLIKNGTVMGYAIATAKRNNYEARIYTSAHNGNILSNTKNAILTLNEDNRLIFNEYKTGVQINLWRWIPYIFRVGIKIKNTRPKGLDGCVRIFPTPTTPLEPRYL